MAKSTARNTKVKKTAIQGEVEDILTQTAPITTDWLIGEVGKGNITRTQLLVIDEYYEIYLRHRRMCNTALLACSERLAMLEAGSLIQKQRAHARAIPAGQFDDLSDLVPPNPPKPKTKSASADAND